MRQRLQLCSLEPRNVRSHRKLVKAKDALQEPSEEHGHAGALISDFSGGSDGEESACNAGDLGLIPGSGRCPGEGNGYPLPLQYSCLENFMYRGAWWALSLALSLSLSLSLYIYIYIYRIHLIFQDQKMNCSYCTA